MPSPLSQEEVDYLMKDALTDSPKAPEERSPSASAMRIAQAVCRIMPLFVHTEYIPVYDDIVRCEVRVSEHVDALAVARIIDECLGPTCGLASGEAPLSNQEEAT